MKNILLKTMLTILFVSTIGCSDGLDTVGGQTNTGVYMNNESVTIGLTDTGGETVIEPRLSGLAKEDIQVMVSVNDFFKEYNQKNKTKYQMLPVNEYELYEVNNPTNTSTTGKLSVTVKKGNYSSAVGLRIKPLDSEKYSHSIRYAIPIRIVSSSVSVLPNKDVVVSLDRPFKTSVAKINRGSNTLVILDPAIPESNEFTVQSHVIFTSLRTTNQTTMNTGGYYSRAINPGGIQIKDGAADGEATWIQRELEVDKWYQLTYVYKGNDFKVYLNGELVKTFLRSDLKIKPDGEKFGLVFGNRDPRYSAPHYLRELRLWNRALTESEIKAGLYLPVDPNSEGLIVYLPIDEKNSFNDVTKYNNIVTPPESFQWIENVKFPSEKLEQQP